MLAGDLRQLRAANGGAIAAALLSRYPASLSRAEIARVTGLSKPTVSSIVNDLIQSGLFRTSPVDLNEGVGAVGRPGEPIELVADAALAGAIDLGATKTLIGIADLDGSVVAEKRIATAADEAAAIEQAADAMIELAAEASTGGGGKVRAIAIGVPGVYDAETDHVVNSVNLPGLAQIRVRATIAERCGVPVLVENDVNLAAEAEFSASGKDGVAVISVGNGIGMGLIHQGSVFRGGHGSAGEIGSLAISPAGPTVEERASVSGIQKLFVDGVATSSSSSDLPADADVEQILDAAGRGDALARRVVDEAAAALAFAIAQMCWMFDPNHIVLGGGLGTNPIYLDAVSESLSEQLPWAPRPIASVLGGRATLLGAVSMAVAYTRVKLMDIFLLGDGGTP